MTELNVPLLSKVLEHVTAHPEEWDQANWAVQRDCGTTYCVAGWTVAMTGHDIDWHEYDPNDNDVLPRGVHRSVYADVHAFGGYTDTTGGCRAYIPDVAQFELGLNYEQRKRLFKGSNDLDTLWQLAEEFSHGEIKQLSEVAA